MLHPSQAINGSTQHFCCCVVVCIQRMLHCMPPTVIADTSQFKLVLCTAQLFSGKFTCLYPHFLVGAVKCALFINYGCQGDGQLTLTQLTLNMARVAVLSGLSQGGKGQFCVLGRLTLPEFQERIWIVLGKRSAIKFWELDMHNWLYYIYGHQICENFSVGMLRRQA